MTQIIGKIFIDKNGTQYGIIRKPKVPFPTELSHMDILAEDECGNFFVKLHNAVWFWDHETTNIVLLADTVDEFINGCRSAENTEIDADKIISAWIDPQFAKEFGIDPKSKKEN